MHTQETTEELFEKLLDTPKESNDQLDLLKETVDSILNSVDATWNKKAAKFLLAVETDPNFKIWLSVIE